LNDYINYYKQISENLDHCNETLYVFQKAKQLLRLTINLPNMADLNDSGEEMKTVNEYDFEMYNNDIKSE